GHVGQQGLAAEGQRILLFQRSHFAYNNPYYHHEKDNDNNYKHYHYHHGKYGHHQHEDDDDDDYPAEAEEDPKNKEDSDNAEACCDQELYDDNDKDKIDMVTMKKRIPTTVPENQMSECYHNRDHDCVPLDDEDTTIMTKMTMEKKKAHGKAYHRRTNQRCHIKIYKIH
ncbi:18776_t:CDS:2, partial [Acaulospora morrowiae]